MSYIAGDRLSSFRSSLRGIDSALNREQRDASLAAAEEAKKMRNIQLGIQGGSSVMKIANYGTAKELKEAGTVVGKDNKIVSTLKPEGTTLGFMKPNSLTSTALEQGYTEAQATTGGSYTLNVRGTDALPGKLKMYNPEQEARFFSSGKYYAPDKTGNIDYKADPTYDYSGVTDYPANETYRDWVNTEDQSNIWKPGQDFKSTFQKKNLFGGDAHYTEYLSNNDKLMSGGNIPKYADPFNRKEGEVPKFAKKWKGEKIRDMSIDDMLDMRNEELLNKQPDAYNSLKTKSTLPLRDTSAVDTGGKGDDLTALMDDIDTKKLNNSYLVDPKTGEPANFASTGFGDVDTSEFITKNEFDKVNTDSAAQGGGNIASKGITKISEKVAARTAKKVISDTTDKSVTHIVKGLESGSKLSNVAKIGGKVLGGAASVYGIYSGAKTLRDKKSSNKQKIGAAASIGSGVAGIAALVGLSNPFTAPLAIAAIGFGIMGGGGKVNAESALAPLRGKVAGMGGQSRAKMASHAGRSRKTSSRKSRGSRYA